MYTSVECVFTVMWLVEILQQGMVGLFKIDWRSSDSAASKVEGFQTVGILFFLFSLSYIHTGVRLCRVKLYSGQEWRLHNRLH